MGSLQKQMKTDSHTQIMKLTLTSRQPFMFMGVFTLQANADIEILMLCIVTILLRVTFEKGKEGTDDGDLNEMSQVWGFEHSWTGTAWPYHRTKGCHAEECSFEGQCNLVLQIPDTALTFQLDGWSQGLTKQG